MTKHIKDPLKTSKQTQTFNCDFKDLASSSKDKRDHLTDVRSLMYITLNFWD